MIAPSDPNRCARCGGQRHAHQDRGDCLHCVLLIHPPLDPRHDFEPEIDPQRTYLAHRGHVYSPAAGSTFELHGRSWLVRASCGVDGEGLWVCISHNVTMPTNALKDYHCYHPAAPGGGPRVRHALVYNCYVRDPDSGDTHGPERAGPAAWHGEEGRS